MYEVQSARIICSGFSFFVAPKSGQYFPAFLVQFTRVEVGETEAEARYTFTYQWRNKRDFLLLKRFITKTSSGRFPKSVYSNLCDQASWMRPLSGDLFSERDVILKKVGYSNVDKDCRNGINYKSFMNKSLKKMDEFLEEVAAASASASADSKNEWLVFCRDEDSESIVPLPMEKIGKRLNSDNSAKISNESTQRAASLGQYFTSEVDASIVVQETLKLFKPSTPRTNEVKEWAPFIFIEPSCGDGRIVEQIFRLFPLTFVYKKCLVLAFDIDKNVVEKCRNKMNTFMPPSHPVVASIKCCNFLDISRNDLLRQISDVTKLSPTKVDEFKLAFIGNPPFTSGSGSGSSMIRDLPSQFLIQSIALGASSVSFLLPTRCDKEVADTMTMLNQDKTVKWSCDSMKLDESKFHFEGRIVSQPSILHLWSKC